jgi:hypothetical protein
MIGRFHSLPGRSRFVIASAAKQSSIRATLWIAARLRRSQ